MNEETNGKTFEGDAGRDQKGDFGPCAESGWIGTETWARGSGPSARRALRFSAARREVVRSGTRIRNYNEIGLTVDEFS